MITDLEFRVIGININTASPMEISGSKAESLGLSKKFLENEFKDSVKKINRNVSLQLQDLINIYGRFGWEHYFQGQIGNTITLYFKRNKELDDLEIPINLSHEEKAMLQSLDNDQLP
tara:strand:+ start:1572 stop:1922 length:351 start_codon:yes stop_codon:yes gene_type:complete